MSNYPDSVKKATKALSNRKLENIDLTALDFGKKPPQARDLEEAVCAAYETLRTGLERAGLEQERRALRLMPQALRWDWLEEDALRLEFELPPGAYATVVLREVADWTEANAAA